MWIDLTSLLETLHLLKSILSVFSTKKKKVFLIINDIRRYTRFVALSKRPILLAMPPNISPSCAPSLAFHKKPFSPWVVYIYGSTKPNWCYATKYVVLARRGIRIPKYSWRPWSPSSLLHYPSSLFYPPFPMQNSLPVSTQGLALLSKLSCKMKWLELS